MKNYIWGKKRGQNSGQSRREKIDEYHKRVQEIFHMRKNHVLDINLCIYCFVPLLLTDIQKVKIWLFYNSNSARVINRWFIFYALEHLKRCNKVN